MAEKRTKANKNKRQVQRQIAKAIAPIKKIKKPRITLP